jgi:hypothetical protein
MKWPFKIILRTTLDGLLRDSAQAVKDLLHAHRTIGDLRQRILYFERDVKPALDKLMTVRDATPERTPHFGAVMFVARVTVDLGVLAQMFGPGNETTESFREMIVSRLANDIFREMKWANLRQCRDKR